jgi:hypothetical protein
MKRPPYSRRADYRRLRLAGFHADCARWLVTHGGNISL